MGNIVIKACDYPFLPVFTIIYGDFDLPFLCMGTNPALFLLSGLMLDAVVTQLSGDDLYSSLARTMESSFVSTVESFERDRELTYPACRRIELRDSVLPSLNLRRRRISVRIKVRINIRVNMKRNK